MLEDGVLPSLLVKAYGEVVESPPPVDQPRPAVDSAARSQRSSKAETAARAEAMVAEMGGEEGKCPFVCTPRSRCRQRSGRGGLRGPVARVGDWEVCESGPHSLWPSAFDNWRAPAPASPRSCHTYKKYK